MSIFDELGRGKPIDPWRELNRLQDELNRVLGGLGNNPLAPFPAVNVHSSAEQVKVSADLPGLSAEQVEIIADEDGLILRGKRPEEEAQEGGTWSRRERYRGSFERRIELPFAVDPERVTAKMKQGVLEVTLTRRGHDKARKVTVESE
jgi:HSP20 family protein